MNKQSKDGNISWTDYTWNPIKGLCPVGCWYCYARKMYLPGFYSKKPPFDNQEIRFPLMNNGDFPKEPSKIFVCSTMEIFHPKIPSKWRDDIFNMIRHHYKHTFQILTKMPENIDRPMPDNVHLGVSVGDAISLSMGRIRNFTKYIMKNEGFYFLSIEPLLCDSVGLAFIDNALPLFGWIIVGRLTGRGKKHDPTRRQVMWIVDNCQELQIPIFLKNNLKEIWGEKLIQEFPE